MDSTDADIKMALNDLPTLSPNLVQNVSIDDTGSDITINITYSSDLGILI